MKKILLIFLVTSLSLFAQTVTVEWNNERQIIDGFGASDAWFSDELMQHPQKDEILDLLFDTEKGAGLSILRHHVPPRIADFDDSGMDLVSGDLDMGTRPYNGLRFVGITIPQNATITNAYIQFVAKDNLSDPATLKITGQAADDTDSFTSEPGNISDRPRTSANVLWTVPSWKNDEKTSKQQTPDLKNIIQEIVNRGGWVSGNSMVIIFENFTGKRSARSFDNGAGVAPELVVQYDSNQNFQKKVAASADDAEENGISYVSYGAQVTQEAFERGCEKVWAAAWSPPLEWKTNNNLSQGGYLKSAHYQDWANYLENYRQVMDSRSGIPLFAISPQNEPGTKPWESCQWDKNKFRDFIKNNLGPTLNPTCKIIVPEETNWNNVDIFYTPTHNDPLARTYVDIVAGHVYGGDPNVSYNHFGKPVWETEWSYDTSQDDLTINNGLTWAHNFWKLLVNAEVSAAHHWWLINFKNDGRQQGLLSASPLTPGLTVGKRLWTIGNFSRFVRPGWVRINATKTPVNDVYMAAFKNPETNECAIIAINKTSSSKNLTINLDGFSANSFTPYVTNSTQNIQKGDSVVAGQSFMANLQAKSVTTFVGTANSTGVKNQPKQQPLGFSLEQNYPNPFNPTTNLRYSLPRAGFVYLAIYDTNGRFVRTLVNRQHSSGIYTVQWNGRDTNGTLVPSGVYWSKIYIKGGNEKFEQSQKMTLIK